MYLADSAEEDGFELVKHIPIRHIPTGTTYPSIGAAAAAHYRMANVLPICRSIWKDSEANRIWDLVEWP